jgi:hypothetical protein
VGWLRARRDRRAAEERDELTALQSIMKKEGHAMTQEHSEDQARRAAERVGLKARKSRWRAGSIDNLGGFQIIDPKHNWIVAGEKFDFTVDDVAAFCAGWAQRFWRP